MYMYVYVYAYFILGSCMCMCVLYCQLISIVGTSVQTWMPYLLEAVDNMLNNLICLSYHHSNIHYALIHVVKSCT